MQLRDYQASGVDAIKGAWLWCSNVLAVYPTRSGKTVMFSKLLGDHNGASVAIAHRQELISQMSRTLNHNGVKHRIIAPKALIHDIVQSHVEDTGASHYAATALVAVASVKTLLNRQDTLRDWLKSVTLWVIDEAHHVAGGNEWMKVVDILPNAKGVGFTATPTRADGLGLGRTNDGVFDYMHVGPSMRDLINRGYIVDYRIFAPPSDLDLEGVKVSAKTGEYSPVQVKDRVEHSHIIGDVVKHYLRIAPGKLGVTFATDVETATDIAKRYNEAGVPAEVVTANTPIKERNAIMKRFIRRELLQLVNVDLYGEGTDMPNLEVVSFARPTQSYGKYVQMFNRASTLAEGKEWAIIIDHVGNIMRHGLPDAYREWTLDRQEKVSRNKHDPDKIPLKACKVCTGLFEAIYTTCPYCGTVDVPAERTTIKQVDGDLMELDHGTLAIMRGEVAKLDGELDVRFYPDDHKIRFSALKRHAVKQEAQEALRTTMEWFGGYHQSLGIAQSESWKRFYFRFGVDVLNAKALKTKEANELQCRIADYLTTVGVQMQ